MKLKRAEFEIAIHPDGTMKKVSGLVSAHFGIEKVTSTVTHLPSGRAVMFHRSFFLTHNEIRTFIEKIESSSLPVENTDELSKHAADVASIFDSIRG